MTSQPSIAGTINHRLDNGIQSGNVAAAGENPNAFCRHDCSLSIKIWGWECPAPLVNKGNNLREDGKLFPPNRLNQEVYTPASGPAILALRFWAVTGQGGGGNQRRALA